MLVVAPLLTWSQIDPDVDAGECLEYLNILDPEAVLGVHQRYRLAGAHCVATNTLRANRLGLGEFGLEAALVDINRKGVDLARQAGCEHILATLSLAEPAVLTEQLSALLPEEPDAIWLVAEADSVALAAGLAAIREKTNLPIIAAGTPAAAASAPAADAGVSADDACMSAADACTPAADIIYTMGKTSSESLTELEQMATHSTAALMACPDMGVPTGATVRQRELALFELAEDMEEFVLAARALQAQFIGTAAGSSPALTGAIAAAVFGLDTLR